MSNPYFDILNPHLAEKGFSEEQIKLLNEEIVIANRELNDALKQEQLEAEQKQNENLKAIFELALANIKPISDLFRPSWLKLLLNFGTSGLLIGAVVYLSYSKILGACETSTILSGIVGYLLGKGK